MSSKTVKFRLILVGVIAVALVGVTAVFIGYRKNMNRPGALSLLLKNKANLSIGQVRQTATRNGIKEWSLAARSANYFESRKQAVFRELSVTFFMQDNQKVFLQANEAVLDTDSNDMQVSGDVIVKNGPYTMNTDELHYRHDKRTIVSPSPVTVTGDTFDFFANSMSFDLNTNRTVLQGDVKGILNEQFLL